MDKLVIELYLNKTEELSTLRCLIIENWEFRTAIYTDELEFEYDSNWQPLLPHSMTSTDRTVFLRTTYYIPKEDYNINYERFLLIDVVPGMEGIVKIDGEFRQGLDLNRNRVYLKDNEKDKKIKLEIEVYCSARYEKVTNVQPITCSCYKVYDKNMEKYHLDLKNAWLTLNYIDNGFTKGKVLKVIENSIRNFDIAGDREEIINYLPHAQMIFNKELEQISANDDLGNISFIAQTHIDDAWLWQFKDTVRKTGRTILNTLRLMEEYPEYEFSFSQPQLYSYVKKHYPDLFLKIKEKVKEGRWHLIGPMWVEPDLNMPAGESFIRQALYGHQFYMEEFGKTSDVCFIPDSFGFPASMPQIFVKCGMKYFFTTKVRWQCKNLFPYNVFYWQGIDGTKILTTIPDLRDGYNGIINPEDMKIASDRLQQRSLWDCVLVPYGYGDGGGGANRQMLENYKRLKNFPGMPKSKLDTCNSYFSKLEKIAEKLPVWNGELYVETHQGTLTTIAEVKKQNRKCEVLFRRVELLCVMAGQLAVPCDYSLLKDCWKDLLLLQFHDVLPGSSIIEVYDDSKAMYSQIYSAVKDVENKLLMEICKKTINDNTLIVLNSNSWEMTDEVCVDLSVLKGRTLNDGNEQVQYSVEGEKVYFIAKNVKPFSFKKYTLGVEEIKSLDEAFSDIVEGENCLLVKNKYFEVTIHNDGRITNCIDLLNNRIVVGNQSANEFRMYLDGMMYVDAWNIDDEYHTRRVDLPFESRIKVLQNNAQKTVIEVQNTLPKIKIVQSIIFYSHICKIDFKTEVDWKENCKLLKVSFPVEVNSDHATYEIAYGLINRQVHANNPWEKAKFEVCGHRFIDLSETGYGVSLFNDCKYGFDVVGNTMSISLLRNTQAPALYCDTGIHNFTYSMYPHNQSLVEAKSVRHAYEMNSPLIAVLNPSGNTKEQDLITSLLIIDNENIIIDAVKPAEDGDGFILRLYECHGARGQASISCKIAKRVMKCTPLEQNEEELGLLNECFSFSFTPFEIKTYRIIF